MAMFMKVYKKVEERCPDCGSLDLVEDHAAGDLICHGCGRVVGERMIDTSSEWRTFSNDNAPQKDKSRVGGAEDVMDTGANMTTNISTGRGTRDGAASLARLQNKAGLNQAERSTKEAMTEIQKLGERLQVTRRVQDTAVRLYEMSVKEGLKGRMDAMAGAALFIALRREGNPRTFKDICDNASIQKKELGKCYKLMRAKVLPHLTETSQQTVRASDFMDRFCDQLNLKPIRRFATHVSDRSYELGIVGGRPQITVAAAALYFASQLSDDKRSMKEIGEALSVAEQTIKQCYKIFARHAKELVEGVEDEFLTDGHTLDELPPV